MRILVLFLTLFTMASWDAAAEVEFNVPVPVDQIALDESHYAPFANDVMRELESQLSREMPDAPMMMLLAMQVHIALHRAETELALVSASRIRALLPAGPVQDYAGLTTRALVVAQQSTGGRPGDAEFNATFANAFAALLVTLPNTKEIRSVLEQQESKYDTMTAEAVRDEITVFAKSFGPRDRCTLAEADRLVRWRHRLADLVPVRQEIMSCLAAAIALRSDRIPRK